MQTVWLGEAGDEQRASTPEAEREEEQPQEPEVEEVRLEEAIDAQLINWRGRITEFCQKRELPLPEVNEIQTCGARGTFSFVCKFNWGRIDHPPLLILRSCGTAKKKKFAKREAARLMCSRLSDLTNFAAPMENPHNPEDRGYWGPSFPACPRSADESGEVCPPLGYEEFDHSEPLPDIWADGYEDNVWFKKSGPHEEPPSRFHPYRGRHNIDRYYKEEPWSVRGRRGREYRDDRFFDEEIHAIRGNRSGYSRMPARAWRPERGSTRGYGRSERGHRGYGGEGPRRRGLFL